MHAYATRVWGTYFQTVVFDSEVAYDDTAEGRDDAGDAADDDG